MQLALMFSANAESVDDRFDSMFSSPVQLRRVVQFRDPPVDARSDEAARLEVADDFGVLALSRAHHGRKQHYPGPFLQREHLVHHLRHALGVQD